jgi:hypothetical protein
MGLAPPLPPWPLVVGGGVGAVKLGAATEKGGAATPNGGAATENPGAATLNDGAATVNPTGVDAVELPVGAVVVGGLVDAESAPPLLCLEPSSLEPQP